jgi:hypothetical protein
VIGIPQETLRHWRSVLPSLAGLKGHAPVFRPGQLLGLAVVRVLVDELGLSVGTLKAADREIFEICSGPKWIRLAQGYLLVRPADGRAKFLETLTDADVDQASILVPLGRIVTSLREALLEVASEEAQTSIVFPPVAVSNRRTAQSERT